MKKLLLLFIYFFAPFILISQNKGFPFSRYYSSQEYQGGIQNYAITQNKEGLIFIANNYGLLEHDGTTWRRYALPNGAKTRHVQIDQNGLVYVSGQGDFGVFMPNDVGQLIFTSFKDKLPKMDRDLGEVWKVYIANSEIYFCTSEKLFIFDKNKNFIAKIESESAFESFHFNNNLLFVNESGLGLKKLQNGRLLSLSSDKFFGNKLVNTIFQTTQDKYLVFTRDDGIFTLDGDLINPWISENSITINTALMLRNGHIAIGTQLDGLIILNSFGEPILNFDKNNGLNNNSIVSLFEDLSGNLWMGHNNGLTMVQLSLPFRKINQYSGLTGTGYNAYLNNDKLYYGTNNGVYFQELNKENWLPIRMIPNSTGQVYQIKSVHNELLVAHNDGAYSLKNNRAERIEGPSGIWNFQNLHGSSTLILVGSYTGLHLYEKSSSKVKYLREINGFNESSRIIEQDDQGYIWVAHGYKGLYRLELDSKKENVTVKYFGPESGIPTSIFNNVWKINNRIVFTTQAGILKFDKQTLTFERDDFFDQYFEGGFLAHFLLEDQRGNIHFIGESEIGVLERKVDGSFKKIYKVFNQLLPLLNDDLQNISSIQGNQILFGANEGFITFNLNDNNYQASNYPTLIRAVYLTGPSDSILFHGSTITENNLHHRQASSQMPLIAYNNANIRFESSNPTPNNEKDLRFQYWLEGLEESYGEWVDKSEKAYTNLREGQYTFHVKSRNLYGEVSPAANYSFRILPPWYRSGLAYFIYFILLLAGTYLIYRLIEKRYQQKAQRLKKASRKVIEEKNSELKTTQAEIEKLKTEKLKHEISNKDKELAAATMHLITKNGFIDHMRENLNSITKKSKNQEVKNEIQKVIKNIEKNIAGDQDWEQFEIHFDQVHGDFMSRFKKEYSSLSPQEIKLSAYLRMNLSTKEIAYLMNISTRGVEIARYRLRKKLNLERAENLQEHILKF